MKLQLKPLTTDAQTTDTGDRYEVQGKLIVLSGGGFTHQEVNYLSTQNPGSTVVVLPAGSDVSTYEVVAEEPLDSVPVESLLRVLHAAVAMVRFPTGSRMVDLRTSLREAGLLDADE